MSVNVVVVSGRLTRDPELKDLGGNAVCSFSLAVDEFSKGEKRANFFDVVAWSKTAETCAKYLTKGREVTVVGRLRWSSWESDGAKRSKVEIVANQVQFSSAPAGDEKPKAETMDIPF